MIKKYYKYGQMKSHWKMKTDECMALYLDAKEKYIRCMGYKLYMIQ